MPLQLTDTCVICGEPVEASANRLFMLDRDASATDPKNARLHRFFYPTPHGYTIPYRIDKYFPLFEDVMPDFVERKKIPYSKTKTVLVPHWMFELYVDLYSSARLKNYPRKFLLSSERANAITAAKLRPWLLLLFTDAEARSLFEALRESAPADKSEIVQRLANIYDLPAFWDIS